VIREMIRRTARRRAVRTTARALRRGVPARDMEHILARSFRHRDEAWREQLIADARQENRKRIQARW
jgi:hypothetical protein